MNSGVYVVNWYDNKFVHPASTFSGVNATGSVKRWDSKAKNHKYVPLPYGFMLHMVSDGSSTMGGVNMADMLTTLNWTEITTKKRWYLKLIFYVVDICKVNGWLLYRRFCDQQQIPRKTQKPLLTFITDLAHALWLSGKSKSVGRPNKLSLSSQPAVGKNVAVGTPVSDVHYDVVDHFPEFGEKRGICRYCLNGYSSIYCNKCFMVLFPRKDKNYFVFFNFIIRFFWRM